MLVVEDLDDDLDAPSFVGKLYRVREEIQEDLEVPPLVAKDGLDQVEIHQVANLCGKTDLELVGAEHQHLQGLRNCLS